MVQSKEVSMPNNFNQVHDVLDQLHQAGVVNLDKSVKEMIGAKDALGRLSPGGEVSTSVIAWDGYGVVIKGSQMDIASLGAVADKLRGVTNIPK
jgi:hypothetical protein